MWFEYYAFIFLSLATFFVCSKFYIAKLNNNKYIRKRKLFFADTCGISSFIAILIILISTIIQAINLVINESYIGYQISTHTNALTFISGILFAISVGTIVIFYYLLRNQKYVKRKKVSLLILFILCIIVFVWYGLKSGNRHVMLQIILGFLYIDIELKYLTKRNFIKYLLYLAILLFGFHMLRVARSGGGLVFDSLLEGLLSNDYYPPAHMLFSAIEYHYINPINVVVSNLANSIVGLGVDTIQMDIMRIMGYGNFSSAYTFAMFVFTEGYVFMGSLGFLYNGMITSSLMYLWRRIANTNDKDYTIVVTAIMICYSIDLVRGQTSYFIRFLWLYLLPNSILYTLLTGVKKESNEHGYYQERS